METIEAIQTRRSIREYKSDPIPDNLVMELLTAAMQAPSAGNQQPWHFIIVNSREPLNAIADVLPFGKMLHKAPLGIVVCGDTELERYSGFWVQDCSNATMNLLLAAQNKGLGAVWVGVFPVDERVKSLKQLLGLPESVIPLCVVSLGFPAAKPEVPSPRFDETRLHHNKW